MGLRTNIFFIVMTAILYFVPQTITHAQIVPERAYDFAQEKQLKPIVDALEQSEAHKENVIQCGKSICNLSSEYCYLVIQSTYGGTGGVNVNTYYQCSAEIQKSSTTFGGSITYQTCTEHCYKEEGFLTKGDYITAVSNENPPRTYALLRGDKDSIAYANTKSQKTFGWCEVLPVKLYNYKKCFFCTLLGVVYTGSAQMTDIAFAKMAYDFMQILALGLAIWIAFQVLVNVSSLTKQDIPKFINNTIKQSYKVVIACILLMNSQQIFTYGVKPLIKAALTFGQSMVFEDNVFDDLAKDAKSHQAGGGIGANHLDYTIYDDIERYVVVVQQKISFMQAIGSELLCIGGNIFAVKSLSLKKEFKEIGTGFKIAIYGIILVLFAFLLSVAFVFYLIDAIVQMGVAGGLSPFLIACWPFKQTAKWTKTGIDIFLNSLFIFIFMGLIMSINVELVNSAMQTDGGAGLNEIANTIINMDGDKLIELTELSGMKFLILIFCCIFGFKFVNQGTSLASQFAKGTFNTKSAIAPSIATMGTSAAKNFALHATKDTREAIEERIDKGIEKVLDAPYTLGKGMVKLFRSASRSSSDSDCSSGGGKQTTSNHKGQSRGNNGRDPIINESAGNKATEREATIGEENSEVNPSIPNTPSPQPNSGDETGGTTPRENQSNTEKGRFAGGSAEIHQETPPPVNQEDPKKQTQEKVKKAKNAGVKNKNQKQNKQGGSSKTRKQQKKLSKRKRK